MRHLRSNAPGHRQRLLAKAPPWVGLLAPRTGWPCSLRVVELGRGLSDNPRNAAVVQPNSREPRFRGLEDHKVLV